MLLQPQPAGFLEQTYEFSFDVKASEKHVWAWLNDPKTFTDTQIWPYRVEFYSPDPLHIPNGFHESVLNIHYGPFINFAGQLTSIKPNYRDLQYFYGSYALNIRWVRPFRLEFWIKETNGATIVTCKISYWVKPWMERSWYKMQQLFWLTFPRFARKGVAKLSSVSN